MEKEQKAGGGAREHTPSYCSLPSLKLGRDCELGMSSGIGAVARFLLFILVFFMASAFPGASLGLQQEEVAAAAEGGVTNESWVMKPLAAPGMGRLVPNESRRRLGSFQICALCTCCGGPRGLCLLSPCCYAINCNIPNRPFGFCSFTPKSCNCLGCYL